MREHTLKVSATFENMNVPPPQGELTFIDNTRGCDDRQIQLKATFPNEDSVLWPGQFVNVDADAVGIDERRRRAVAGGADRTKRPVRLRREIRIKPLRNAR